MLPTFVGDAFSHRMRAMSLTIAAIGLGLATSPALAGSKATAGTNSGISWKASNKIVAVGSTATAAGGVHPPCCARRPGCGEGGEGVEKSAGGAGLGGRVLVPSDPGRVRTAGVGGRAGCGRGGRERVPPSF